MSEVEEHLPVLREFVEAVNERDPDVISACLQYTPPGTLATIAAMWISELLTEADDLRKEIAKREQQVAHIGARYVDMRNRRNELRALVDRAASTMRTPRQKEAA